MTEQTKAKAPDAAPIKSAPKVTIIDGVDKVEDNLYYPFVNLEPGQGFFIPNEQNQTTQQAFDKMHYSVLAANSLYAEIECDQNGDEVWEEVIIKTRARNPDGTLKLGADGKPVVGHDPVVRPKLVRSRRYVVRQIAKDTDDIAGKKAEFDGILVYRAI